MLLLENRPINKVRIGTPKGIDLDLVVENISWARTGPSALSERMGETI